MKSAPNNAVSKPVARDEFTVAGFRNRDLRRLIHPAAKTATKRQLQRLSAETTR